VSSVRAVPSSLKLQGEAATDVVAQVRDWSVLDRVKRGVIMLGICWALAGVTIVFPIIHLFVPPILLLTGPVLMALKMSEAATLDTVEGLCPRCKKAGEFSVGGKYKPLKNVTCNGCGNLMELSAK
jgi:hypothetical protein